MFLINKIEYEYFDCFISIDIILPTHILAKKNSKEFLQYSYSKPRHLQICLLCNNSVILFNQ